MLDDKAARRRIQFAIEEARLGFKVRDHAITYALRVASNYYSIGRDTQSKGVKKLCRLMSRAALDKFQMMPFNAWHDETTNEHWLPVGAIWADICNRRCAITVDDVVEKMKMYGMVVITYDEDRRLSNDLTLSPEERYGAAGIEVMEKQADNSWKPFQRVISASNS